VRISKSLLVCVAAGAAVLGGCGENYDLTETPISVDVYVDSTYSNDQADMECVDDVMEAAKLAAASRGHFKFHTFDGDPFRGRGINEPFDELVIPGGTENTAGETGYLEGKAEDLQPEIEELIIKGAEVPGTPLIQLFERAGRHTPDDEVINRILICTDGLFTDLDPNQVSREEAVVAGEELPIALEGTVVDFIGLDGSSPERGRYVERTRPLVQALLTGAGMRLGAWDLELPVDWRKDLIALANSGSSG
jgi:hypothetical protein